MFIQPIDGWRGQVNQILKDEWGCPPSVSMGNILDTTRLPGFAYVEDGELLGAATYNMEGGDCELVTLNSLRESRGIGTALVNAVLEAAREHNCRRLWLITTNDNTNAIGFYQKRGFELIALHRNAMDITREIKPGVPLTGMEGIPLKHELEFEIKFEF